MDKLCQNKQEDKQQSLKLVRNASIIIFLEHCVILIYKQTHNQYKKNMGLTKLFLNNTTPTSERMEICNETLKQDKSFVLPKLSSTLTI